MQDGFDRSKVEAEARADPHSLNEVTRPAKVQGTPSHTSNAAKTLGWVRDQDFVILFVVVSVFWGRFNHRHALFHSTWAARTSCLLMIQADEARNGKALPFATKRLYVRWC